MKLMHISDLHLGKRVNEISMLEDQRYILEEILRIAQEQTVDGILASGDIYNKTVPSAEAVLLLDWFLTEVSKKKIPIFLISGNHDSAERLAFGAHLLDKGGIYISPVYEGKTEPITLKDSYGEVRVYGVPFLKPAAVRRFFPERKIETYQDAFEVVMESLNLNLAERNVLIAHQFFAGAERCESEELSVGGLDVIRADALGKFDYVALGHLHRPQKLGRETVRYCGTPLKYSFSEANDQKSVSIVELKEKGNICVETIPLKPRHDLREIRGSYEEITLLENYKNTKTDDYMHITLTDEEDIPNAVGKLRVIYPNLMKLDYDNRRTREYRSVEHTEMEEKKSPLEYFMEFYQLQNNQEMSGQQRDYLLEKIECVWGDE